MALWVDWVSRLFLETPYLDRYYLLIVLLTTICGSLVNAPAFGKTFNNPDSTMIGLIVAIYEGITSVPCSEGVKVLGPDSLS
jgi:hypothetical protein